MSKKTKSNTEIWAEIKVLENQIDELKKELAPATLPKQADLNECNRLARKAVTKVNTISAEKLSVDGGVQKVRAKIN